MSGRLDDPPATPFRADHPAAMLGVVPVREGVLPLGADEVCAEAGGRVLVIGSGCEVAVAALNGVASLAWSVELAPFAPHRWARCIASLVPHIDDGSGHRGPCHLLLPASPDGRDLAPRLAAELDRPFVAGTIAMTATGADVTRFGGRVTDHLRFDRPVVATLQPGVRGVVTADDRAVEHLPLTPEHRNGSATDPELIEQLPPDPSTMDLAEADRIVGGGAGLGSPESFERLAELAARLGASPGGTRVVTDWGWLPVERQVGTTGVTVDPSLYIAIGVSGAVQHTAGLGSPDHVISVNTDPHCPMMGLADLAIVCDGPEFLDELLSRLRDR